MSTRDEDAAWETYKFRNWINPQRDQISEGAFRAGYRANKKTANREPEYEYGTRWPLSEDAHGPGKVRVFKEESLQDAQQTLVDVDGDPERHKPVGVAIVRRVKAGEWEEVKNVDE